MNNITLIKGWGFSREDYEDAFKKKRILSAQIETTGVCDLNCPYCYRAESYMRLKRKFPDELSLEELTILIDEIKDLGTKTINVVGAGEPLIDSRFWFIIEYISKNGITPVVFTNGGKIDKNTAKRLYDLGASVIIKINSFNEKIQDFLVNKPGYTKRRNVGLKNLIETGFNKPDSNGDYQTRLGIDSIICKQNKDEILDILRFCRENNIMPLIKTFIPTGRTAETTDMEISEKEFFEISERAQKIDKDEFGIEYGRLFPYLGGVPCTQNGVSIFVSITGDIKNCPGQTKYYGNFRTKHLKYVVERMINENFNSELTCQPRIDYYKRINQ